MSPDPLGPQDKASLYTYVGDNPLRYADPSGLQRNNTCGSLSCYMTKSAGPACLNAINPFNDPLPIAFDFAKSTAAERFAGKSLKSALGIASKEWIADFPVATTLVCLNAAATSGFSGG